MSLIHSILATNPNYVYPLAVNIAAAFLPVWAGLRVAAARRQTGLKYPAEYWEGPLDPEKDKDKFLFNCTQRAHQNLLENLPTFLILLNVCAISHPRVAAGFGGIWILARALYQIGYGKRGPKGRARGARFSYVGLIGLLVGSIQGLWAGYAGL